MEIVHEALDEAKLEIEKLGENYKSKVEFCDNLKRAHNELVTKNQEANLKVEKLTHELTGKEDELAVTKHLYEAIETKLKDKETAVKHLSSINDKLRADYAEMHRKFEEENKGLALALDGANATNMDLEHQICSLKQEIEGLREVASASQKKKSSEAEKRAKDSKELRNNNDMLLDMEEENRKLADQLKWRKEQFMNLEEAHSKLRQQLQKCEEEKKGLALALDGANSNNTDQEQQIRSLKQEVEGLRKFVLASQKKSSEAEKRAKGCKEPRCNDDMLLDMEEENRKLADQLKWKKEQFSHLEEAHSKLRQQLRKYEEDNRGLALALDGANATHLDQEQQIRSLKQEIEGLREFVSSSQKSSEAEKRANASKELRHNDNVLLEMEEENKKLTDQLKWKKEQFSHLEEAHGKLRQQHREEEKEWVKERCTLLDEISKLQLNLDSQLRISKDLESRFWMCNQALAHEESRRKLLEVQLAESKTSFDSVCAEYEESRSTIESLTSQRDKEIANLRDILGTRDTLHKEMEYQFRRLEQENHELMTSLKEFQEAKIQEAGASSSSLSKLRNKLKGVEQVHKDCFSNLKTKEAEWASKLEQLTWELDCCKSSLLSKDTLITELQEELETCESLTLQLTLQNEETSMMLLVLKSQFLELYQRVADDYAFVELEKREGVENISTLIKQLNTKNEALVRVQKDLEEEREKVARLSEKVDSLTSEEKQQLPLQREVDTLKEMLKEALASQHHVKEQVFRTKSDLKQVRHALDRANEELAESFSEGNELEFELQVWKSVAEKLKANLEENHQMRRQVEASLLSQADVDFDLKQERESLELKLAEKDKRVNELQQQLFDLNEELQRREQKALLNVDDKKISQDLQKEVEYLEQEWVRTELEGAIFAQVEAETKHKNEKENLHQLVNLELKLAEKDRRVNELQQQLFNLSEELQRREHKALLNVDDKKISQDLQKEVEYLEQEWVRKELEGAILAQVEAETKHKNEKEGLHRLVEEKDHRIYDLQKIVNSLENEFEEKDHRIYDLQQLVNSLENEFGSSTSSFSVRLTEMQAEVDMFHKTWEKMRTAEILKDIEIQMRNLVIAELENDLSDSVGGRTELEAELEAKRSEIDVLQIRLEKQIRSSDIVIKKLHGEKAKLLDNVNKTWEKMRTAEILKEIEIHMRNLVIAELENDLSDSVGERTELEAELEAKRSEIDVLQIRLEKQIRSSDIMIKKLNGEKAMLLDDVNKLSSDKDKLLDTFMGLSKRIDLISKEDMQLSVSLERMVQNCDNSSMLETDLKWDNYFDPVKENKSRQPSTPTTKKLEAIIDDRSPLRSLNN